MISGGCGPEEQDGPLLRRRAGQLISDRPASGALQRSSAHRGIRAPEEIHNFCWMKNWSRSTQFISWYVIWFGGHGSASSPCSGLANYIPQSLYIHIYILSIPSTHHTLLYFTILYMYMFPKLITVTSNAIEGLILCLWSIFLRMTYVYC